MYTIIMVGIVAWLFGLLAGYIVARLDGIYSLLRERSNGVVFEQKQPQSFFTKQRRDQEETNEKVSKIAIDERKFVSNIKTDNIHKVTDVELGKKTTQPDNINESVSRLAQLKSKE